MARILWTLPFQFGCFSASVPIAQELRARGHDVVALSTPSAEKKFLDLQFDFRPDRRIPPYDWRRQESTPMRLDRFSFEEYRRWFIDLVPNQMADVMELLDQELFDLILTDCMLYGPGFAAEKAGLPWVSYVTLFFDEAVTADPAARTMWDALRARVDLPPDPRPPEDPWYWVSPYCTLVVGLPELAYRAPALPPYVHHVGPLAWDPPLRDELPTWLTTLGRQRPAVLVTTSTAWMDDVELVDQMGEALGDEDLDIVVTIPAEHELPSLPENFIVTGYLPHGLVLPKVQLAVCSAGWGFTTRAVCCGVPLVLVARGGDGYCVAKAAAKTGAAVALDARKVSPTGLRSAVMYVLGKDSFSAQARRLHEISRGYDAARTGADLIEHVMGQSSYPP